MAINTLLNESRELCNEKFGNSEWKSNPRLRILQRLSYQNSAKFGLPNFSLHNSLLSFNYVSIVEKYGCNKIYCMK